jgi:poly-beta-hydroxyalkanoate depolymerase
MRQTVIGTPAASRKTKIQLVMLFKIINDLVDIPSSIYLIPANSKMRSNHSKKMQQYHTKSDVFKYSLFPRTTRNWNQSPETIAETPDLVSFKRVSSLLGSEL